MPASQHILSDDERLARQLQMEEDSKQSTSARYPSHRDLEQERRDAELARQFADMDVKPAAKPPPPPSAASPNSHHSRFARTSVRISLKPPPPSTAASAAAPAAGHEREAAMFGASDSYSPPRHQRALSVGDPRKLEDQLNAGPTPRRYEDRASRSFDEYLLEQSSGPPPPASLQSSASLQLPHRRSLDEGLLGGGLAAQLPDRRSLDDSLLGGAGAAAAAPSSSSQPLDDRLEYARRLQEEAFFNLQRTSSEAQREKESAEQADREFAMRMQRQEDERSASMARQGNPSSLRSLDSASSAVSSIRISSNAVNNAVDRDKALAKFMAESGASFSELSTEFLNDLIGATNPNESRPEQPPLVTPAQGSMPPTADPRNNEYVRRPNSVPSPREGSRQTPVRIPIENERCYPSPAPSPLRPQQTPANYPSPASSPRRSQQTPLQHIPLENGRRHPSSMPPTPRGPQRPPAPIEPSSMENGRQTGRRTPDYGGVPTSPERRSNQSPPRSGQTGGLRLPQAQQNSPSSPGSATVNTLNSVPTVASEAVIPSNNANASQKANPVSPGDQSLPNLDKKSKKRGHKRRSLLKSFRRGGSGSSDDGEPTAMTSVPSGIPPPAVGVPGAIPDAPPPPIVRRPPPPPPHAIPNHHHPSAAEVLPGRRASCGQPVQRAVPMNGVSEVYSSPRRASTNHMGRMDVPPGGRGYSSMRQAPHSPVPPPSAQNHHGLPSAQNHHHGSSVCAVCHQSSGPFLAALDKKYHPGCFRCAACHEQIDPYGQFKVKEDGRGGKTPYHPRCYSQAFGSITCTVCRNRIPASRDGTVAYVKHPFFEKELMCRRHAEAPGRVCSGCRRFEPVDRPFVNLSDSNRCVCPSCFRTVVVDNRDVPPLWHKVLAFFEYHLNLPVWNSLKDAPIILVDQETLTEQLARVGHVHCGSNQLVCGGACLTDQDCHGRRFKLPAMQYVNSTGSFEAVDDRAYYEIPRLESSRSDINLSAILCLCGLPSDLTATILAHEATHAWIKLHPKYRQALPPDVEEGCAQLIAMLFLNNGLGPHARPANNSRPVEGPTDEQLRQYYKFCIERDNTDLFGASYRRAAKVYCDIGIEALLNHVVHYREFPHT